MPARDELIGARAPWLRRPVVRRAAASLTALVLGAGVGRAAVAEAGPSFQLASVGLRGTSPSSAPTEGGERPAGTLAVDGRPDPGGDLAKYVPDRPAKGMGVPADAWENAWSEGRSFEAVPDLPDLPADTAATLALARLTTAREVDHDDVVRAARRLGIDAPPRLDQATLDRVLLEARRQAAPLLRAAGIEVGSAVDAVDVVAAARRLGLDIGTVAGTDDVRRILNEARAAASPVLWAASHDPGSNFDAGDLDVAGARLGVDVAGGRRSLDTLHAIAEKRMQRTARAAVSPGLDRSRWSVALPGGTAVAHVLRWSLDDPRVQLMVHAAGGLDGRATIPQVHAAVTRHAANDDDVYIPRVTVNGGFWMGSGDPDGLLVAGGTLLSDPTTRRSWVRGQRGAFGIDAGEVVVGRPDWVGRVVGHDVGGAEVALEIRGVNRHLDLDHDLVAFTPHWGGTTRTAPGTVELVLHDVTLGQFADADTVVGELRTSGNAPIPTGGIVLSGTSRSAEGLRALAAAGATVQVTADAGEEWVGIDEGLGAGPLLLADGRATSRQDWHDEGFGDGHNLKRHPRTAIGFTADGEALLVVVDGRRPGWSIGMTTPETIRLLRAFGATDALMLDGGGSSHLVIGGRTANRPCCDASPRPVSTALVLAERPAG